MKSPKFKWHPAKVSGKQKTKTKEAPKVEVVRKVKHGKT